MAFPPQCERVATESKLKSRKRKYLRSSSPPYAGPTIRLSPSRLFYVYKASPSITMKFQVAAAAAAFAFVRSAVATECPCVSISIERLEDGG